MTLRVQPKRWSDGGSEFPPLSYFLDCVSIDSVYFCYLFCSANTGNREVTAN